MVLISRIAACHCFLAFSLFIDMRGYHIYNEIWDAMIGEELQCLRESNNANDRYMKHNDDIVGHVCVTHKNF